MGGLIVIQDLVAYPSQEDWGSPNTIGVIEELVASPIAPDLFTHKVTVNKGVHYISTFLKWSTVGGTASDVFGGISDLIAVYNQAGLVYYADNALTSTLNTLTDEEVYKVVRENRVRPYSLSLENGEKVTEDGVYGFAYTFTTGATNWYPWCVAESPAINLVLRDHKNKVISITDSEGGIWTPLGDSVGTNTLQFFNPGNGYLVDVNTEFSLTIHETTPPSLIVEEYPAYPPGSNVGDTNITVTKNFLDITIPATVLQDAVSQIVEHSSITALKVSEVTRYRTTASIPDYNIIQTFYAARGQAIVFNHLMGIDNTYASTYAAAYDRKDFQADYNAKLEELNLKTVKYTFNFINAANEVIGGSKELVSTIIDKLDDDYVFKVTQPLSANTPSKSLAFTIVTDGVTRKFLIGSFHGRFSGRVDESKSVIISNTIYPKVDYVTLHWVKDDKISINQLYCTNPT
jgi:hypothetical protein